MRKISEFLKADLFVFGDQIELEKYDVLVFRASTGIVVRKLCEKLRNKFEDPAVVVIDPKLSFAIPLLGGHEGANEVAKKLESLGMKAIITTSAEFEEGYTIGVGFRKNASSKQIVDAILEALNLMKIEKSEVKILATALIKKKSKAFREAVKMLGIPAGFVSDESINSMNVSKTSAVKIGLKNVSEACALYYSKNKELVLPKKVFGGVTVAVAR
ncbi:MAG: cobalamin biosynthesis protein [Archaeoglobaceae archaeon]|nr:cobalamin biosynthesis protein [Archaeoglobaceae archaeon]MDW8128156.1 cobalamin biosynthesis protein [Archaeoglobaceae archaeon]